MTPLPPPSGDMEKPRLLSDEEVQGIRRRTARGRTLTIDAETIDYLIGYIDALLADRHARIEQNRKGIETMFEKMCELDTPKRGELHLLLISLFS